MDKSERNRKDGVIIEWSKDEAVMVKSPMMMKKKKKKRVFLLPHSLSLPLFLFLLFLSNRLTDVARIGDAEKRIIEERTREREEKRKISTGIHAHSIDKCPIDGDDISLDFLGTN